MIPPLGPGSAAGVDEWATALASLHAARHRREVSVDETPAPARLAPDAVALAAELLDDDGEELGSGRLVVLHDPAGQDAWGGRFRVVAFVRAVLETEMAADPMLADVGWAWLEEALAAHGAGYVEPSGTVTRTTSTSYGAIEERPVEGTVEIRASWTPVDAALGGHACAWTDLLCAAAGLPPLPVGVTSLPGRRG